MGFHAYWLRSTKLIAFNSLNWNVLWNAICFSDVFCGEWQNVCLTAPHRQYPGTMVLGAVYVGMSPLALVWSLRFYNMLLDNTLRLWQMPGCIHLIKVQPVYKFLGYLEILNWLARYPPIQLSVWNNSGRILQPLPYHQRVWSQLLSMCEQAWGHLP